MEEIPSQFSSLAGTDRRFLYAVGLGTGFRASELASLTPDAFDLAQDFPTVTLAAEAANGTASSARMSRSVANPIVGCVRVVIATP